MTTGSDDDLPRQPAERPQGVDLRGALRTLDQRIAATNEVVRRAFDRWTSVQRGLAAQAVEVLDRIPAATMTAAAQVLRRLRDAMPPNWRGLVDDEFERVLSLAQEGTICIVWVPRVEIVRDLIDAPDHDERERILVRERAAVLVDVGSALDDAVPERIALQGEVRGLVHEALVAAEAGCDRAAQALIASALTRLLHDAFGFTNLGEAYKEWRDRDPEDAFLDELRTACIQRATVNALRDTGYSPRGFNRHGTQHGDPAFLHEAAMLAGFLLVGAWVREIAWAAEYIPDALDGERDAT